MIPRRILLVDDDLRVHELVRWALRPPRFEVEAFVDPRQALARVAGVRPDLIICDMMMPTMDGQVFLRLVKQDPNLRRIPFLFLTAVRLGSEVQAALNAGAEAYLVKPFPLARLVETVNQILDSAQASSDAAGVGEPSPGPAIDLEQSGAQAAVAASPAADAGPSSSAEDPPLATGLPAAEIPRRQMQSDGKTVLSDSLLSVPERADEEVQEGDEDAPDDAIDPGVPPPVFEGRFSTVAFEGQRFQVVTEAESRPNFVITTIISVGERGLRKIESFWSHPLRRPADVALVKRQIDLQHERAVADVRCEPLFGPRRGRVWDRHKRQ